jgi:hypothetical protein
VRRFTGWFETRGFILERIEPVIDDPWTRATTRA